METELAGPWLASLTGDDAEAYVAGRGHAMLPRAVFWSCPDGDMVLWRRLRTINEILIPKSVLPETSSERANATKDYARVLFRRWDPNVLANIIPILSDEQFAKKALYIN